MPFPLLAIETSCDETAAAVIGAGGELLSEVVRTQVADHAVFGGVVPELASRRHVEWLPAVVDEALLRGGLRPADIGAVAVTVGPGLAGCLLCGLGWAQGFALARDLPLLGVNHLEGHLLAPFVAQGDPPFPFVALTVSGGHTSIVRADALGSYEVLGETVDDAAGEAFDKGARLLGMPYPGGALVDQLADGGDPRAIHYPRGLQHEGPHFSFSGLKTAVRVAVEREGSTPTGQRLADHCASLREAIVDVLVQKCVAAVRRSGLDRVVLTGGVGANRLLRERLATQCAENGWQLHVPPKAHCTDNAAMIGAVAALWHRSGAEGRSPLDIDPSLTLVGAGTA